MISPFGALRWKRNFPAWSLLISNSVLRDLPQTLPAGWDHLLMDDPEKRVADPERQHAKAVWRRQRDLSPAQKRLVLVLIIFGAVTLPAILLCQGVYDTYAYSVGTPATATNIHCEQGKGVSCYGDWSIGGEGTIEGIRHSDGSSLNVHVHDGTAYTPDAARRNFTFLAVVLGFYLLFAAMVVTGLVRQRRRRAARNG
jgi:hypothetical protein